MSPTTATSPTPTAAAARMAVPGWAVQRVLALVERNMMIYRRSVTPLAFGLVEPLMYLITIGFGVGALVGTVPGVHVRYAEYVAPA
ncbi:MAG: ABC transporter permease, partial [Actinocrinis sp.]